MMAGVAVELLLGQMELVEKGVQRRQNEFACYLWVVHIGGTALWTVYGLVKPMPGLVPLFEPLPGWFVLIFIHAHFDAGKMLGEVAVLPGTFVANLGMKTRLFQSIDHGLSVVPVVKRNQGHCPHRARYAYEAELQTASIGFFKRTDNRALSALVPAKARMKSAM